MMSESNNVTTSHHHLPTLTHDNFRDWEVAIISFLTNMADHVCVIEQCLGDKNVLANPKQPTNTDDAMKWDASEREALGIIMSTASRLH